MSDVLTALVFAVPADWPNSCKRRPQEAVMANEIVHEELTTTSFAEDQRQRQAHEGFFPAGESESFRARWSEIQANFVDEPKHAVEQADELLDTVIQRVTQALAEDRSKLERELDRGGEISTEDLRLALRRYRTFFDRLLSI